MASNRHLFPSFSSAKTFIKRWVPPLIVLGSLISLTAAVFQWAPPQIDFGVLLVAVALGQLGQITSALPLRSMIGSNERFLSVVSLNFRAQLAAAWLPSLFGTTIRWRRVAKRSTAEIGLNYLVAERAGFIGLWTTAGLVAFFVSTARLEQNLGFAIGAAFLGATLLMVALVTIWKRNRITQAFSWVERKVRQTFNKKTGNEIFKNSNARDGLPIGLLTVHVTATLLASLVVIWLLSSQVDSIDFFQLVVVRMAANVLGAIPLPLPGAVVREIVSIGLLGVFEQGFEPIAFLSSVFLATTLLTSAVGVLLEAKVLITSGRVRSSSA